MPAYEQYKRLLFLSSIAVGILIALLPFSIQRSHAAPAAAVMQS